MDEIFRVLAGGQKAWELFEPLKASMALSGIDLPIRQAHFLAQCAHESGGFLVLQENLNYSAIGLATTWPRRFRGPDNKPNGLALGIQRKPMLIANEVYANRMGNGDAASGDGWQYRGRGIIQLTGRENYGKASMEIFHDIRLIDEPDQAALPDVAAQVACWYWTSRDCNSAADRNDVPAVTRKINGGLIGLDHRKKLTQLALEVSNDDKA
jgi:putative chitinase